MASAFWAHPSSNPSANKKANKLPRWKNKKPLAIESRAVFCFLVFLFFRYGQTTVNVDWFETSALGLETLICTH